MRLGTARTDGGPVPVALGADGARPLAVESGTGLEQLIAGGPEALAAAVSERGDPIDPVRLTAPLRPGKIVCVELNYLDNGCARKASMASVHWGRRSPPPTRLATRRP